VSGGSALPQEAILRDVEAGAVCRKGGCSVVAADLGDGFCVEHHEEWQDVLAMLQKWLPECSKDVDLSMP